MTRDEARRIYLETAERVGDEPVGVLVGPYPTATQKAKALLAQYHAAKATYESPDPHDREERRYDSMNAARARVEDVALVEALLAEREWQPIETAPRDGSWVLVHERQEVPMVARWYLGGWQNEDGYEPAECDITHWQPLPAPPEADHG